jgi:hypothetical protein
VKEDRDLFVNLRWFVCIILGKRDFS